MKAIAPIKELLQQLQSLCSGKKTARSGTAAKGKAEAGSNEVANLCQLAHAVLSAISSLRKTVQASAMQAPCSGCKAGKIHIDMDSVGFHLLACSHTVQDIMQSLPTASACSIVLCGNFGHR